MTTNAGALESVTEMLFTFAPPVRPETLKPPPLAAMVVGAIVPPPGGVPAENAAI